MISTQISFSSSYASKIALPSAQLQHQPVHAGKQTAKIGALISGLQHSQITESRRGVVLEFFPPNQLDELLGLLRELAGESCQCTDISGPRHPGRAATSLSRVETVNRYLLRHLDSELDYKQLARHVGMEQASLCRLFKRSTGMTITAYLNQLRINEAVRLMKETDQTTLDISLQAGFENYSNFVRQFRRVTGMIPREMRERLAQTERRLTELYEEGPRQKAVW